MIDTPSLVIDNPSAGLRVEDDQLYWYDTNVISGDDFTSMLVFIDTKQIFLSQYKLSQHAKGTHVFTTNQLRDIFIRYLMMGYTANQSVYNKIISGRLI